MRKSFARVWRLRFRNLILAGRAAAFEFQAGEAAEADRVGRASGACRAWTE